jgi:L-fucose isomerase
VQDAGDPAIPADVQEKLLRFARAGLAMATMQGRSYLSMGAVSMGIAGSIVNPDFFQKYLGMRNEFVDMSEFTRRIEEGIFDPQEFQKALAWVKKNCPQGPNRNPAKDQKTQAQLDKEWEFVVMMTLIARDLMVGNPRLAELGFAEEAMGHHAIASGFQGQRQWTDHFPNGDFMEAMLCSSFDWNGIREAFVVATENDSLNAVAMLFGHLLSGTAQVFADVRTYWSPDAVKRVTGHQLGGQAKDGIIHLINSGAAALDGSGRMMAKGKAAMKACWDISQADVEACLKATVWSPATVEYFRGGGFSSSFSTTGVMPITMVRVNLVAGLGPVLQLAEGWTVELPAEVAKKLEDRTDPTWPSTWFAPRLSGEGAFRDVYSVMNNWGANHGSFSYGHIGADLISLCSMLRIPVCMHNVAPEKLFRPAVWSAFGTAESESADYRACAAYGPVYGKA